MRCPMPIPRAPLFFLVILSIHMSSFELALYCMAENNNSDAVLCPEVEKEALLSFKQSSSHPSNELLSSWNNGSSEVNCCKWGGVVCNNFTGHVSELHLRNYGFRSINPSLLNLTQIRYLDLSSNNFDGMTIPSFIGSLQSLEYLNLLDSGFHGTIPKTFGNLSNLHTLSLGYNSNGLDVDSLEWLLGLSNLELLNMNRVNLSKASANWVQVINTLPSLVELYFSECNLNFNTANMMNEVNVSSSLSFLDLSSYDDFFGSRVPRWMFQLSNLIFLDLSGNYFEGPIPSVSNTTKLQRIDLSRNKFNSTIPGWLYSRKDLHYVDLRNNLLQGTMSSAIVNLSSLDTLLLSVNKLSGNIPREIAKLCKLRTLGLHSNKLQGELSDSFRNMSDCFLDSLQYLSLGDNQLSGNITHEFGEFKSLTYIDVNNNLLSGAIPSSLGQLTSLERLLLAGNQLSGNLPKSLGKLFNLEELHIEGNKLEGIVTEIHFANLTKLEYLDASYNHRLTLKVNPDWIPPFQLKELKLVLWDLGTKNIPSWLETQKNLNFLDLSSIGISGTVPNWIWGISILNLSHNHLYGKIPDKFGNLVMYLSSNQFKGRLPRAGSSMIALDLSNNSFSGGLSHFLCDNIPNLRFLNLGGNQLTGELSDCFMNLSSLEVLKLGNNSLSGGIPNSIGFLTSLKSLNLYRNNFSGRLPFSMSNCTDLVKIDLHGNNLDGNIPTWIGTSLTKLAILILRSNKLSGEISSDICLLNSLQVLDLSDNLISGIIPSCVNNFTAMVTQPDFSNLFVIQYYSEFVIESATVFSKGRQNQYDTILSLVTNLDLSNNNLSGDIPKGLTSLMELRSLNLSGNQLTGLIPSNIGDMKQLESLDFSLNFLSGGVPDSFKTMSYLNYLNLSYNRLTGRIPESTQFNTFNASSFSGNQLCGPPLTRKCTSDGDQDSIPDKTEKNGGGKPNVDWFYVFVSLGFAVGFSAACSTLVLKKSWRDADFGFVEDIWDNLYVFCYVKWRMFARRR